jgi:hypothetical protein
VPSRQVLPLRVRQDQGRFPSPFVRERMFIRVCRCMCVCVIQTVNPVTRDSHARQSIQTINPDIQSRQTVNPDSHARQSRETRAAVYDRGGDSILSERRRQHSVREKEIACCEGGGALRGRRTSTQSIHSLRSQRYSNLTPSSRPSLPCHPHLCRATSSVSTCLSTCLRFCSPLPFPPLLNVAAGLAPCQAPRLQGH